MGPDEPDLDDHQSGSTSCYRVTSLPVRAEMIHSMIRIRLGLTRVKMQKMWRILRALCQKTETLLSLMKIIQKLIMWRIPT